MTLLQAGQLLHPFMDEDFELRFGRVAAAQLASLSARGHLSIRFGGEYIGSRGLVAERHPAGMDQPASDERQLMDVLFADEREVRVAHRRPDAAQEWNALARVVRERLLSAGLGWRRRERYRAVRRLIRLRKAMRDHVRLRGPLNWDDDPVLYRAGYPLAVLFHIEGGARRWPAPPEDDPAWVPYGLPEACTAAIHAK
ncbi:hypothetical protein ACFZAE_23710 [Streptomyces scabiei]|uniref:hypothetical protein n=1 Tax=Streptomyces scabiei TaxID=1930 RepID=UPI0036E4D508